MMLEIAAGVVLGLLMLPLVPGLAVLAAVAGGFWAIFHYDLWLALGAVIAGFCLLSGCVYHTVNFQNRRAQLRHIPEVPT